MKKFVTLALALIMALSLAAPALAFTGMEYEAAAESGITLDVRLVDVSNGFFGSSFNAPATNRGYAQNQVVCAIVSLFVPKGVDVDATYDEMVFAGKNVSLYQDDNFQEAIAPTGPADALLTYMSQNAKTAFGATPVFYYKSVNEIVLIKTAGLDALGSTSIDETYQFAIFGRVLADDAEISATLKGGGALLNASDTSVTDNNPTLAVTSYFNLVSVKSGKYLTGYFNPNINKLNATAISNDFLVSTHADGTGGAAKIKVATTDIVYLVTAPYTGNPSTAVPIFAIVTDNTFKTKGMYVFNTASALYRVQQVDPSSPNAAKASFWDDISLQFVVEGASPTVLATSATISTLMNTLENVVAGDFGLDYRLVGTYMKPDWWAGNAELSDSVKIEPWYAEVTVPPEIELEIPKTGDALSVMGFVLIALAGLAVVAVRKVKA